MYEKNGVSASESQGLTTNREGNADCTRADGVTLRLRLCGASETRTSWQTPIGVMLGFGGFLVSGLVELRLEAHSDPRPWRARVQLDLQHVWSQLERDGGGDGDVDLVTPSTSSPSAALDLAHAVIRRLGVPTYPHAVALEDALPASKRICTTCAGQGSVGLPAGRPVYVATCTTCNGDGVEVLR